MAPRWPRLRSWFARGENPNPEQRRRIGQPAATKLDPAQRVMSGISAKRLIAVLRAADQGDYDQFLLAAQELEERDAQYGSQMSVRRAAVSALELTVERPPGVGARAARGVEQLVNSGALKDAIHCSLDAIGKGYAITEIVWVERRGQWVPTFVQHDPREFQYIDQWSIGITAPAGTFRLRDGTVDGVELRPLKWVQHIPKGRSGIPIRRGTARPAMFLHMAKSMSLAGWIQLMAVFGLPLAIGTVAKGINDHDRRVLQAAIAGLGRGHNAIVPEGAAINIVKAADAGASPEKMFEVLLKYVDAQMSKLVLGQTMTSDDGSSQAQAKVHNEVRGDIREGDAEQLAATLNRDVIRAFVDFNFGPQRVYPEVSFLVEEERDIQVWGTITQGFIDRALPVLASEVYAMLGLTKPPEIPDGFVIHGHASKFTLIGEGAGGSAGAKPPDDPDDEDASS